MPMVSLKLMGHGGCGERYGSRVRENDGRGDSRAMVSKEGPGGGPREATSVPAPPGVLTGFLCSQ